VTQLALLHALLVAGIIPLLGNALAFFAASQLNFVLNSRFTWRDRGSGGYFGRWRRFMASISLTALMNLTVFALLSAVIEPRLAALAGIGAAALANFLIADRLVFVRRPHADATHAMHESAARTPEISI
jgi:putative flippase GtrA